MTDIPTTTEEKAAAWDALHAEPAESPRGGIAKGHEFHRQALVEQHIPAVLSRINWRDYLPKPEPAVDKRPYPPLPACGYRWQWFDDTLRLLDEGGECVHRWSREYVTSSGTRQVYRDALDQVSDHEAAAKPEPAQSEDESPEGYRVTSGTTSGLRQVWTFYELRKPSVEHQLFDTRAEAIAAAREHASRAKLSDAGIAVRPKAKDTIRRLEALADEVLLDWEGHASRAKSVAAQEKLLDAGIAVRPKVEGTLRRLKALADRMALGSGVTETRREFYGEWVDARPRQRDALPEPERYCEDIVVGGVPPRKTDTPMPMGYALTVRDRHKGRAGPRWSFTAPLGRFSESQYHTPAEAAQAAWSESCTTRQSFTFESLATGEAAPRQCPECNGSGCWPGISIMHTCRDCGGTGRR